MAFSVASASYPSPRQDFCVAVNDTNAAVFVNGKFCKDPKLATPNDFSFSGLGVPGNTSTNLGPWSHQQTWHRYLDSTPWVSLAQNRLISRVLYKGDVFVFPQVLIHFQLNVGTTNAVAIASLSSQNPGVITIANAVFGSSQQYQLMF
ncbi:Germin-like protein [Vitis vinifera]|uniref:Germin-like protein n=1 Tax=Vitis vinifera TaxID=29760 RepID=A0A438CEX0_VITVI|nr:Germin-like protein [Vitis vinifera]